MIGSTASTVQAPLRVLIADDYPDTAESLALLLSNMRFEVQIAHDGADAMRRARVWHPNVCILDLSMPKADGRDVASWIHRQSCGPRRPLLIALTGWGRWTDKQRVSSAGFDYHFVKPAEPLALLALVSAYASGLVDTRQRHAPDIATDD